MRWTDWEPYMIASVELYLYYIIIVVVVPGILKLS